MDVVVVGAGPAGVMAAARAAELGARTTLVTRGRFGGMAAHDGPVPVRTLAHAARLLRDAKDAQRYGIRTGDPSVDYAALLGRVREIVEAVHDRSSFRQDVDHLGITLHEGAGTVRFRDAHTLESESGLVLTADRVILCTGGVSRRLAVPGAGLTATHSDAWGLTAVPRSLIVIGGGMTGLQVASIFHAFGSRVSLFQSGPRILAAEDEDVSSAVARALRDLGMDVREGFGRIDTFERIPGGVRMHYSKGVAPGSADAELVVVAIGWAADTAGLHLDAAGIATDAKGFVRVDEFLATSAPDVLAAGDVTGRLLIVPPALQDGWVAGTNAVRGSVLRRDDGVNPIGSFTDPEYARVGATEAEARAAREVVVGRVNFDETTRTIIDGRTNGFCKLVADRSTGAILGCHVVGERAVDIVQVAAIALLSGITVDGLARIPLSYPTYAGILARAAYRAARQIDPGVVAPGQRGQE